MEGLSTKSRHDVVSALEENGEKVFETRSIIDSLCLDERLEGDCPIKASQNVLYHLLEYGYIELDPSNLGIQQCYEEGFIHRTKACESNFVSSERDICVFPSRLHEKY